MESNAFFSDTSERFVTEWQTEGRTKIRVRFRGALNDKLRVSMILQEKKEETELLPVSGGRRFRYYACTFSAEEAVSWLFLIEDQESGERLFYDRRGASTFARPELAFQHIPGFRTPEWAKGAIMYQIFVDRFRNGGAENDVDTDEYIYIGLPVQHIENWDEKPSPFDVGYFYGGDLNGVREKFAYLKDLGVEVIYFNPLFVSPSNHKYDTQDYEHIDPHLTVIAEDGGKVLASDATDNLNATRYQKRSADPKNLAASDRFFAAFTEEAHRFGFRILLDGVFNHCGSFHKWLDREKIYAKQGSYAPGAYLERESPYHDYFVFMDDRKEAWPDNRSYDGWWDNDTLPKLNYEASEELAERILRVGEKWLSPPYRVDGWRLDVAADLGHTQDYNHSFWKRFRARIKAVRRDALILAEHYGNPSSWLNGREWDSVMNYDGFMEPVSWFLTGMEKHSDGKDPSLRGDGARFWDMMSLAIAKLPEPALHTAMNQLSNHDHSRFLTRTNGVVGRLAELGSAAAENGVQLSLMRQAALMLFTWPGAPTMYYGDEVGVCGFTDPDSRRSYPWGHENLELLEYHRYLSKLHRNSQALRRGSLVPLLMERDLVCYGRVFGREQVLTFVYTGQEDKLLRLPYWKLGDKLPQSVKRVMLTYEAGYNVGAVKYAPEDGMILVYVTKNSAGIYLGTVKE